jgi:hypothetical protein
MVAEAAEIASVAPTWLASGWREEPLGNRTRTSPSQNAMRKRKNMTPNSPAARPTAAERLAGSLEAGVAAPATLLSIFEENTPQIFEGLEKVYLP